MGSIETSYDYVVLGAGPAGLQMGYFLKRADRSYIILEGQGAPGSFFRTFPRHRRLLSINKVQTGSADPDVNLRWDWNSLISDGEGGLFKEVTTRYYPDADHLRTYLARYADNCQLNIRYQTDVVRVSKANGFILTDTTGQSHKCRRLVVTTGYRKAYVPDIPGIELAENYATISVNPDDFTGQRVLIIGKGNSAFETANHLTETTSQIHMVSPSSVVMAWQSHFPGHLRAINNNYLDTYQLRSQNVVLDARVERITRIDGEYVVTVTFEHVPHEPKQFRYDRVIVCTGFKFDDSLFDDTCRPALTTSDRFPNLTTSWESTSVQDLFFAGALMYSRGAKTTSSGFIHGFRYNIRALHRIFECRYHGARWPSSTVDVNPDSLVDVLLYRINHTSALWQQFGSLCDLIVLSDDQTSTYYEEVPIEYVNDSEDFRIGRYLILTLEYGQRQPDPFSVTHDPRPEHSARSTFLHPVVRLFDRGNLVREHHVLENLAAEWGDEQLHRQPLLRFLAQAIVAPMQSPEPPAPTLTRVREQVTIVGAGLVGTLLSILLAQRGYPVTVFDRQPDPRAVPTLEPTSINLTLSTRGLNALTRVGVSDVVRKLGAVARGRMIHMTDRSVQWHPYGHYGEALLSVSPKELHAVLLRHAEAHFPIQFRFGHTCTGFDPMSGEIELEELTSGALLRHPAQWLIATDAAFSALRLQLQSSYRFDYSQEYSWLASKELDMLNPGDDSANNREALHIWPRGRYMLLAIPNRDGTFTAMFLLPQRGDRSQESLRTDAQIVELFEDLFPDALDKIPDLVNTYVSRCPTPMLTLRCSPWACGERILLLGDAAHANFPPYGQGVNAGFEDCLILAECLDLVGGDWAATIREFETLRKPHTDAAADLSRQYLLDLGTAVGSSQRNYRDRLESKLNRMYPSYLPLASMVSFTNIPFANAVQIDRRRRPVIDTLLEMPAVRDCLDAPSTERLIAQTVRSSGLLRYANEQ